MSFDAFDFQDAAITRLKRRGYTVHCDRADPPVPGPCPDTGWWYSFWGQRMTEPEVGETVGSESAAWSLALEHYFDNTNIEVHRT